MLGIFENTDRKNKESSLDPVDVILLTLDAEIYLEKCLDSAFREIPVNRLIVLDGGSKDRTLEILKKYPRTEIFVRPDIKTTGKGCEFLFSKIQTNWFVFIDADIEFPSGWYEEMVKHKAEYDFLGCKRFLHYEFYRLDPTSIDIKARPMGAPYFIKTNSIKNYRVDDDYMLRATDILLRQVVEKNGYKFGKVASTYHYHHTTENLMYESDSEKRGSRLVFTEPKMEILDQANWEKRLDDFRKAMVKYIEPEYIYPQGDPATFRSLLCLDQEWVRKVSPKWHQALSDFKAKEKEEKKKSPVERLKIIAGAFILLLRTICNGFGMSYKKFMEAFK